MSHGNSKRWGAEQLNALDPMVTRRADWRMRWTDEEVAKRKQVDEGEGAKDRALRSTRGEGTEQELNVLRDMRCVSDNPMEAGWSMRMWWEKAIDCKRDA